MAVSGVGVAIVMRCAHLTGWRATVIVTWVMAVFVRSVTSVCVVSVMALGMAVVMCVALRGIRSSFGFERHRVFAHDQVHGP